MTENTAPITAPHEHAPSATRSTAQTDGTPTTIDTCTCGAYRRTIHEPTGPAVVTGWFFLEHA